MQSVHGTCEVVPTVDQTHGDYHLLIYKRKECDCCHIVHLYKGTELIRETRINNLNVLPLAANWRSGVDTMERLGTK